MVLETAMHKLIVYTAEIRLVINKSQYGSAEVIFETVN